MATPPSTFRSANDATLVGEPSNRYSTELGEVVSAAWERSGQPDLVHAIADYPELLADKSLVLSLALKEYDELRDRQAPIDLKEHCGRFEQFGSVLAKSIYRRLQTKALLDNHPELLDLFREPTWPEIGEQFGPFQILETIGSGAHSRVYLCRESEVGNRVVVAKVTPYSELEASILGRLQHEGIMPIHSTGTLAERRASYICMPFRGRSTLQELIGTANRQCASASAALIEVAARRWERSQDAAYHQTTSSSTAAHRGSLTGALVEILTQLAGALAFAHERHVLHGDLKPSNVLLTPEGKPLLLDFNLSMDSATSFGPRGGTLPYMAPEHVRIVSHSLADDAVQYECDVRSDIYSFGVLAYELLTSVHPFDVPVEHGELGDIAERILERQQQGPRSARQLNPLVSARLDRLLKQCLATQPEARPSSMREVEQLLRREAGIVAGSVRQARRRPLAAAVLFSAPVIAVAVAIVAQSLSPPPHLARFETGLAALSARDYASALSRFDEALALAPDYHDAQFYKALATLRSGDIPTATREFSYLARLTEDGRSIAYRGYCMNLEGYPAAAIVCYEQALEQGLSTPEIENNWGISYLTAPRPEPVMERAERAVELLKSAHAARPDSVTITTNLLRTELHMCSLDKHYYPQASLQCVDKLLRLAPEDFAANYTVARLLGVMASRHPELVDKGFDALWTAAHLSDIGSRKFNETRGDLAAYRTNPRFPELLDAAELSEGKKRPPKRPLEPLESFAKAN